MRKIWLLGLSLASGVGIGTLLLSVSQTSPSSYLSSAMPIEPTLQYQVHPLPAVVIHTLSIPVKSRFEVVPAIAPTVATLDRFAKQHHAIAVLNAGFFDPENQQSTAFVTVNGKLVADPQQNQRLTDNPNLKPYLDQIFNRSEFRRYQCGDLTRYDISLHREPPPQGCQLREAIGGGPRLLPEITAVPEGFVAYAKGEIIRDALGIEQSNARTAIGITGNGKVLWVMAAQKPNDAGNSGISLSALAAFMKTQGVVKAMNLDGGSSSALYYNNKIYSGKVDTEGNPVQRPVKSVLLVKVKAN
jgi:hypothetical protein